METKRRSIGYYGCSIVFFLAVLISLCGCWKEDYGEYPVEISDELFNAELASFRSRFLLWQESWGLPVFQKELVGRHGDYMFFEFPITENTTCYFRKPKDIFIGHDKWQSGCVAHEIGHAVLYTLKHPCWGEFEHELEKEKCLARFR